LAFNSALLCNQYTIKRLFIPPQWKEFDLEVYEFIYIVSESISEEIPESSGRCNLQDQGSEQSEISSLLNGG
jgi:hypothetical protein